MVHSGHLQRSLREAVEKRPDSRCVTWDVLQSALLSEGEDHKVRSQK